MNFKSMSRKNTSIVSLHADPQVLKEVMIREIGTRQVIMEYIKLHMKKGTDYGSIEIVSKKTGRSFKTKPSLFKPGSEKFLSLFKLQARFRKDSETWEMAGSYPNIFTYVCELFNAKGVKVGEGRGATRLDEKHDWTVNNAIKIAQKRAQIDAVLRTGALSDFFTQDFEEETAPKSYRVERLTPARDDDEQSEPVAKDYTDKGKIKELMQKLGKVATPKAVKDLTGIDFKEENYKAIIKFLDGELQMDKALKGE